MSTTNQQLITEAYQKIGVVDELQVPTASQSTVALTILNDFLLSENRNGLRVGWFPQTSLAATAPLRDEDIWGVKLLLCRQLISHYGIKQVDPMLLEQIEQANKTLTKRSLLYMEADFSELSRPQGGPWGGPNWI